MTPLLTPPEATAPAAPLSQPLTLPPLQARSHPPRKAGLASYAKTGALALLGLRTHHHGQSAALSGMAQSIGYLLAATGPIVISILHDASGAWVVPLIVMLGVIVVQVVFGVLGSRDRLLPLRA